MAQNITINGESFSDVPAVEIPITGGGTASFVDTTDATASASEILYGYTAYGASGEKLEGTAVAGSGSAVSVVDTLDTGGGTIRTITAVSLAGDTVAPNVLLSGYTAHNALGQAIVGTASGSGGTVNLQSKTVTYTPSESQQTETVTADSGYDGLSSVGVTVDAISSNYIGSGITQKAAATYNTSTTDQTIASGQYLSGTQTIKAVTVSGLSASNIASGVTVKVGDANDDDRITSVTGTLEFVTYYTGSTAPSASTGSDGDIYLQTGA